MNIQDQSTSSDGVTAIMNAGAVVSDSATPLGTFHFEFYDASGVLFREETVHNLFTTVGKGQILTSAYAGSAYTATEYMGLISSVGFGSVVAADTMSSHAGWNEAQNTGTNTPPYGTVRPTLVYGSTTNGTITTSTPGTFVATGAGTVTGAFVVGGSGASATVGNTSGVLMNEGTLGTAQPVISGNTVIITHSGTLT
jgi:hypothetical protein